VSPPVTLHDALVAWLANHANDPKPERVAQVQAVLFEPREGETGADA
jgi:predicted Abi (CAAX) family protease